MKPVLESNVVKTINTPAGSYLARVGWKDKIYSIGVRGARIWKASALGCHTFTYHNLTKLRMWDPRGL